MPASRALDRDHREAAARGPSRVRSDDDLWWRSPARGGGATACGGAPQLAVSDRPNGGLCISRRKASCMAPHPRLGYFPSELPVNTCFDGICTNMSRKGPFECQTDSPRRPHLRPRKGTNLDAGNPSPASCSASSRCQPCAPLARLKKYFQSFRANPFNQHTSAGSSMSARSTWRSLGVDFTPSEARSGEVEGGEVDLGLLRSPVPG